MKKVFFLSIISLLAITSCKKSSTSNGTGTITANVDGTPTTFNTDAQAFSVNSSGVYSIAIGGFQGAGGNSYEIAITIGGTAPVTSNTTYGDDPSINPDDEVSLVYSLFAGNNITAEYGADGTSPNTATTTITSISATNIQGTFSGGVTLVNGSGTPTSHTITNGRFNVKVTPH
jgi:hypothetical protein